MEGGKSYLEPLRLLFIDTLFAHFMHNMGRDGGRRWRLVLLFYRLRISHTPREAVSSGIQKTFDTLASGFSSIIVTV